MSTRLGSATLENGPAGARPGDRPQEPAGVQTANEHWVAIARILRPRGRKGEVIAEALSDFRDRFHALRRGFIERPGAQPELANIAEAWWHQERLILRFAGVASISQAESLRGRLLFVPREERVALGEHQYYQEDLIGCEVVSRHNGKLIGKVASIERTSGVDLLQVARASSDGGPSPEILIPFAQEICPEIDVRARRIVAQPPEGLLELNDGNPENSEA